MTVLAAVPRPAEIRAGAADTKLLLLLRWRLVRGLRTRLAVVGGLFFLLGGVFLTSNVGGLVRRYAEQGADSAAGQYAVNYVIALQRGELGAIGAAALGSALAAALFSPFTGAANIALYSADDLTGLRPRRLHRYFDALITTSVSTIGVLQLITLTAVASLITLQGGRTGGLLFTWAVWPVLVLAAVAEGWAIELIHRTFGPKVRKRVFAGLGIAALGAIALDPNHGKTLFGIGTLFASSLARIGHGDLTYTLGASAVVLALGFFFLMLGLTMANLALAKAAVPSAGAKPYKRWIPISGNPRIALLQILFAQVGRTTEVRRPIATVIILCLPAAWIKGDTGATMTTLVLAIPLACALAWGVNTFGVIGPGMTWLSSQPHLMRMLLPMITLVQLTLTAVIATLCWLPPFLGGRIEPRMIVAIACGTVVSTAVTTRSANTKAVKRPYLARLGVRGDVIVPPLTAINYTLRFAAWSGQFGLFVLSQSGKTVLEVALVVAAVSWSSLRYFVLVRKWSDRTVQSRVVATVAAA